VGDRESKLASEIVAWASAQLRSPYVLVSHVEGLDGSEDLVAQMQAIQEDLDLKSSVHRSQAIAIRSSTHVRKVVDALHTGEIRAAQTLVKAQLWPSINVVAGASELSRVLERMMQLGPFEVDTAVLCPGSRVGEIRILPQGWTASVVAGRHKAVSYEPLFLAE
jgi:hypothetical protein